MAWLLARQGDLAGARAAYQLAISFRGWDLDPEPGVWGVLNLAKDRAKQGDLAGARTAYELLIDFGNVDFAVWAASLLESLLGGQDDVAGARAADQRPIDYGDDDHAPRAAFRLGELLQGDGDIEAAMAAYQVAIDSGRFDAAPDAAYNLGPLLAERGDVAGARACYQLAFDSGYFRGAPDIVAHLAQLLNETADGATAAAADQSPGSSGNSVTLSNRDRIDRGLEFLAAGLRPFVDAQMTAFADEPAWAEALAAQDRTRYGTERRYSLSDPRFLLRVITEQWGAFKDRLSQVQRGFASELRETGNRWAHNEAFSAEDTYRALDTIERLLTAIGAVEQASHVRRIRTDLQPPRSDG